MALDITRGLFGIELPASSLSEDQAQALAFAQLSPEQAVRASGMMSGKMLGRGVGDLGRAAFGGITGVDIRNPDERRQAAQMRVLQTIKERGIDPEDPEAYLPVIARAFQEEGLVEDALKAATALQNMRVGRVKGEAEVAAKRASALKDLSEADPTVRYQKLAASGHFKPESIEKFKQTGNYNDLLLNAKGVQKVETDEGVYLVPESTMHDRSTWERVGDVKKTVGGTQDREVAATKMNALKDKHRMSGENDEDMMARLSMSDDPKARNDAAMIRALAAAAVGTDHAEQLSGGGVKLTETESTLFGYSKAAEFALPIFQKNWGAVPPPSLDTVRAIVNNVAAKSPNTPMTLDMILTAVPDKAVRQYIGDAFGVLLPVLRKDTGAAIAASEWINYFNTYIPEATDNPQSMKDKMARLNERVVGMKALADSPRFRAFNERYKKLMGTEAKNSKEAILSKARGMDAKELAAYMRTLNPEQKKILNAWLDSEED